MHVNASFCSSAKKIYKISHYLVVEEILSKAVRIFQNEKKKYLFCPSSKLYTYTTAYGNPFTSLDYQKTDNS